MILVLVGTHNIGFDRLVQSADDLAALISETVIIQKGSSTYIPRYAEFFDFASGKCIDDLAGNASVMITHAAAGSILLAILLGKPLVVVPRLKRFGEALDDHQQQLAKAIAVQYEAPVVNAVTGEDLFEGIQEACHRKIFTPGNSMLVQALSHQLSVWERVD